MQNVALSEKKKRNIKHNLQKYMKKLKKTNKNKTKFNHYKSPIFLEDVDISI